MTNIESLQFYMETFGVVVLLSLLQEKFFAWRGRDSRLLSFFLVMIPTLVSGLRYMVGTDYTAYTHHIRWYTPMTFSTYLDRSYEVGHYFLIQLDRIFESQYMMFFVAALLTVNFFYEGLRYYKDKVSLPLGMMLYLFTFFPHSLNVIRQYLAVSIIFYGYRYVFEKDIVKYGVAVIVAMSFHLSAVAALPFYFIHQKYCTLSIPVPKKMRGKTILPWFLGRGLRTLRALEVFIYMKVKSLFQPYFKPRLVLNRRLEYENRDIFSFPSRIRIPFLSFGIYCFLVLLFFYFGEILAFVTEIEFFSKFTSYITSERDGENRELYLTALILFGVFAYRRELKSWDARNGFFISLLVVGSLLGFLGYIDADIKRVALYFDIGRVVLLASLPKAIHGKGLKFLFSLGLVAYSLAFFFVMFYHLGHSEIFPYQSIFGEGQPLDGTYAMEFFQYILNKPKEG